MTFEQLDFVYTPSHDVAADMRYFTDVLGARLVFAIDAMGIRVAMLALGEEWPRVILTRQLIRSPHTTDADLVALLRAYTEQTAPM